MMSVPGLTFPFFVHCVGEGKKEAAKLGDIDLIISDGQVSSPKQTADIEAAIAKKVDGIVISPNDVDALVPALQEAVDAKIPLVTFDRRVKVPGSSHVGATMSKAAKLKAAY
jgi:ribose transport system substrate-binding protein/inositol transport system substrate-binding protein